MRKFLFLSFILFGVAKAQITNPAPYCLSSFTSTSIYPEISKVEMSNITNSSTKTPAPGYTYYNTMTGTVVVSNSYTIKVTGKNADAETMLKGWIDYNNNKIFENNELIISVPKGSVGFGNSLVHQASFTVPVTACCNTRMRISYGWHFANWGSQIFNLDSCHTAIGGDGSSGETEDYDINIAVLGAVDEFILSPIKNIYPNPVSDRVVIELNNNATDVKMYDALGKEIPIMEKWNKNELDLSGFPNGIYFLEFTTINAPSFYRKIIKE